MYEETYEFKNILNCGNKAKAGTSWKASVQNYHMRRLRGASRVKKQLKSVKVKKRPCKDFELNCRGKVRIIQAFGIEDRVIHKSLNTYVLRPAIGKHIFYDNSATIEGRGNDFAIRRLICHLEKHYRKYKKQGGILLLDFSNYFNNINRDLMYIDLLYIIDSNSLCVYKQYTERFYNGLGVGSEICQTTSAFYPTPFDHNAKHYLRIKFYHRYMDDSYLIHQRIKYLQYCLESQNKVAESQEITLNLKHTQIVPLTKSFIYMKKEFYIEDNGHITVKIQKKYFEKRKRKLKEQRKALDKDPSKFLSILQSQEAWFHYAEKYASHKQINKMNYIFFTLFNKEICDYVLNIYKTKYRKFYKMMMTHFFKELIRLLVKYNKEQLPITMIIDYKRICSEKQLTSLLANKKF